MHASVKWHTQAGSHTADNRDAFAHAAQANASIYLIADGSSNYPHSGELAHALLNDLTRGFGQLPTQELNAEQLVSANVRRTIFYAIRTC